MYLTRTIPGSAPLPRCLVRCPSAARQDRRLRNSPTIFFLDAKSWTVPWTLEYGDSGSTVLADNSDLGCAARRLPGAPRSNAPSNRIASSRIIIGNNEHSSLITHHRFQGPAAQRLSGAPRSNAHANLQARERNQREVFFECLWHCNGLIGLKVRLLWRRCRLIRRFFGRSLQSWAS
jgi:hypothetical protein